MSETGYPIRGGEKKARTLMSRGKLAMGHNSVKDSCLLDAEGGERSLRAKPPLGEEIGVTPRPKNVSILIYSDFRRPASAKEFAGAGKIASHETKVLASRSEMGVKGKATRPPGKGSAWAAGPGKNALTG